MLVVCHHLREERPLHDAHHRGLFLVVGLKAGTEITKIPRAEFVLEIEEEERHGEKLREPPTEWTTTYSVAAKPEAVLSFKSRKDEAAPRAPRHETKTQNTRETPSKPSERE